MKQTQDDGSSQSIGFYSTENKALQSPREFRIRKQAGLKIKPIQCENHEFNFDDIRIGKKIGSGAYGDVYIGFAQGKFIAVKQLDGKQLRESVDNEIDILSRLKHPNIVQYYGYKREGEQLNLYMEYMDGGSLSERIKQFGKFNEVLIRKFTLQILEGLIYLHNQGVAHRDLKCGNILSNQKGQIKLADFGASYRNELQSNLSDAEFCDPLKGSFKWMAPEILLKERYGRRVDIWSLGCVVIEMASGEHPWPNIKSLAQLIEAIKNLKCPPIPSDISNECQNFIQLCCTYKKEQRPPAEQLKDHPWFKKQL